MLLKFSNLPTLPSTHFFCWTKLARWALLLGEIGSLRFAVGRNWLAGLADLVTPYFARKKVFVSFAFGNLH